MAATIDEIYDKIIGAAEFRMFLITREASTITLTFCNKTIGIAPRGDSVMLNIAGYLYPIPPGLTAEQLKKFISQYPEDWIGLTHDAAREKVKNMITRAGELAPIFAAKYPNAYARAGIKIRKDTEDIRFYGYNCEPGRGPTWASEKFAKIEQAAIWLSNVDAINATFPLPIAEEIIPELPEPVREGHYPCGIRSYFGICCMYCKSFNDYYVDYDKYLEFYDNLQRDAAKKWPLTVSLFPIRGGAWHRKSECSVSQMWWWDPTYVEKFLVEIDYRP